MLAEVKSGAAKLAEKGKTAAGEGRSNLKGTLEEKLAGHADAGVPEAERAPAERRAVRRIRRTGAVVLRAGSPSDGGSTGRAGRACPLVTNAQEVRMTFPAREASQLE